MMTPNRCHEIVFEILCQNVQQFARFSDIKDRTVSRWLTGAMVIPEALVGFRGGGSGWGSAEARSLI
jgi:hypothetical protein